jgi:alpha-mannosidase
MPVFERGRVADQDEIVGFIADIAPFGAASVTLRPAKRRLEVLGDAIVEVGGITATVGENGIQRIEVDGLGVVAEAADYNVGELILEHDDGDPWATRTLDRTRERLAQYTRLESVVRDGDAVIVSYRGEHPSNADPHHTNDPHVVFLVWRQRFVFRAGVDRVDVETEVDWYTASRRLRLAFPSPHKTDTGVYDIPYGVLERKRYDAVSTHGGNGGGDWPAVNWAGIQAPDHTFAIFNQGTPSYRIEQGTVLVSVLRSPQLPYGLLEPESYTAYNFHGMSDGGKHHFRHALSFERGDWRSNATAANAALFNRPPVVVSGVLRASLAAWRIDAPHTEVSSVKASERGGSLILRLVERSGAADTVNIEYPRPWRKWRRCNLLEDPLSEWANGSGLAIPMKPWEIATIELGV